MKMKAAIWSKYGEPKSLNIGEMEIPMIKKNDILIKVLATTATLGDCELRSMELPFAFSLPIRFLTGFLKPKKNKTLGQEFSGIVVEVGDEVKRFKPDDEIFGQTGLEMGTYAQFLKIPEKRIITFKPDNISFAEAACVPLGGLESVYFINKADIKKGESVLVIGAGGSIGTMGIQILKLAGATVTGVDTEEKFDVMQQAGADNCIDYIKENYFQYTEKYDAILDVVGKTPLKRGLELLKPGGRYMHVNPKIRQMLFNGLLGSADKKVIVKVDEQSCDDLDYLADLLEKKKIKSLIDKILPLDKIVEAHEYIEAGKKKGNLVIAVEHDS